MKDVFGLIYTSDESDVRLRDLTRSRSIAAMPIGGRYRVIDVLLSNMVHSDITNVGLITQRNYHSLMDHLEKRQGLGPQPQARRPVHPAALRHPQQHRRLRRHARRHPLQPGLCAPRLPALCADLRLLHGLQHHV